MTSTSQYMMHVVTPVKSASASDSPQLLISIDGNIGIVRRLKPQLVGFELLDHFIDGDIGIVWSAKPQLVGFELLDYFLKEHPSFDNPDPRPRPECPETLGNIMLF